MHRILGLVGLRIFTTSGIDHITTHHVVVVVLLLLVVLVGTTSSKKPKAPSFQIGSG